MTLEYRGPFAIRTNHLRAVGDLVPPHLHHFFHITKCKRGRVRIVLADAILGEDLKPTGEYCHFKTVELGPGEDTDVPPEKWHSIEALEPDSVSECWYTHRAYDGEVSQMPMDTQRAYS